MSSDNPSRSTARHSVLVAIKIAVSLILLTVLFSQIDVARLWAIARGASVAWLAAAVARDSGAGGRRPAAAAAHRAPSGMGGRTDRERDVRAHALPRPSDRPRELLRRRDRRADAQRRVLSRRGARPARANRRVGPRR